MTVRCPRCGTRYRRPSRARRGADATFRCARCRHVFSAEPAEPALLTNADVEEDDVFTLGDEDDAAPVVEDEPRQPRPAQAREPREPAGTGTARFAVRALLAVSSGYAVLSIYLYTHPQATRAWLGQVPVVGQSLAERTLHPGSIQLTGVRGDYERVKGDKLTFVVSGTATNSSAVPVRGIQVQARLLGGAEQRQVVFVGAAPHDVQDLSLREIALLQTIEPPKDWALPPGEQAKFLVVFATPPADLREFSAEVVAVQAPRQPVRAPAAAATLPPRSGDGASSPTATRG